MKVLIIPDIHCRKFWRQTIFDNIENVEKIIFLGDYFDSYNEGNLEEDEISMLNNIINLRKEYSNKVILLIGNHDEHYIWDEAITGSRFNRLKAKKYYNIFNENLDLFNLSFIQDDVIFSHAGITEGWAYLFLADYMEYDDLALSGNLVLEAAQVLMDTPLKDFNIYYINALNCISRYRGGLDKYGSCLWADLREHCYKINGAGIITPNGEDGIYQIFGHTQLKDKPIITNKWACLDCRKGFIIDTLTHEITDC